MFIANGIHICTVCFLFDEPIVSENLRRMETEFEQFDRNQIMLVEHWIRKLFKYDFIREVIVMILGFVRHFEKFDRALTREPFIIEKDGLRLNYLGLQLLQLMWLYQVQFMNGHWMKRQQIITHFGGIKEINMVWHHYLKSGEE